MTSIKTKRSKFINLSRMRKSVSVAPIAASLLLMGCGEEKQVANIYTNLDDCISDNPNAVSQCTLAYENALEEAKRTGPKFASQRDCEYDFGVNQCRSYNSGGSSFFMPFMAGYMLSNLMSPNYYSQPLFTSYSRYSPHRNSWLGADGRFYGDNRYKRVKVSKSDFKQKPAVVRTIKRGGFGSTAKAKSSWGSSRSRSGWGG